MASIPPRAVDLKAAFTDHDRLFKELLTIFFVDFVELFLPEIAADMERDSITFLDKELFTDVTSGEKHEVDIIVRARFRGSEAFFILHMGITRLIPCLSRLSRPH